MSKPVQDTTVSLRPFQSNDEEFLVAIYGSTREAELAMVPWDAAQRLAFVRSQHASQLRHYQAEYPNAVHQIIELDGQPIGRLYVDRRKNEIRIMDITLLPEHRGQGIGSPIIRELMDEAAQAGTDLTIHLESFGQGSRSQSLFERLGFKSTESNGFHVLFVWNNEDAG